MKLNIEILNDKLKLYNQISRITFYSADPKKVILNDVSYYDNDALKIIRRLNGDDHWIKNFDSIYLSFDIGAEKKIKSMISAKGGKSCQLLHGDRIKENLNTGVPWNKNMKGFYPYPSWCKDKTKIDDARLQTLSNNRTGEGNPMFGTTMSVESKNKKSKIMKQKILDGTFTPNSNNRNTHWNSYFKDKKFRSSWEAIYYSLHPEVLYESLRIPYTYNNKEYVYIVDFVNHSSKEVIEIKPKELLDKGATPVKLSALTQWAVDNLYSLHIITQEHIEEMSAKVNIVDFDSKTQDKIRALNETYKKNRNR